MPEARCDKPGIPTRFVQGSVAALSCCLLLAGCASHPADTSTSSPPTSTASTTTSSTSTSTPTTSTSTTSTTSTTAATSTTTTTPSLPGLQQPTAANPLTILDVGDSLGEDLGLGLGYTLDTNPLVRVVQDAYGDSGLARPDFYDWPAHLAAELNRYHPQMVMILIGGNDAQNFLVNGEPVVFGTAQWHTIYSQRVALMMSETLKAGAKMLWVGLPIMQSPAFGASMQMLNAIYQTQAALQPGVVFFPTWSLFSNAEGHYSAYLTNSSGQTVLARDDDGIHIAPPGGCDIIAVAAIREMEKVWHVHIGV